MKNKKKQITITLVAIISLIVITVGVTYAFFNYAKEGTTDNTIQTGSTLDNSAVKVYLTEVNGTEQELLLSKYSELSQTDRVDANKYTEKVLYESRSKYS